MSRRASLKPVDERWMLDALLYVVAYRHRHGRGPTWRELYAALGWERKPLRNRIRMGQLTRRGLAFTEAERSLDVTQEGRSQLRRLLATRKADAKSEERDR